ncbi:hypothetical protein Mgra_00001355 [Meloidogyne graminicola]|uniref:Uncharacterized protein n=1 Tax=Meloidogyne graminicola TaxID=189291 RepID=A0A8S9ZZJ1_9BILA|nr:hypothetical protein Mgra_00001355 [Meloidogyne graminicola]
MKIYYENSEEHLNNLREWYKRRSADFQSSKYLENKARRSLTTRFKDENAKYERKMEIEGQRFRQEFDNKMRIALSKYQPPPPPPPLKHNELVRNEKEKIISRYTRKIICSELKPEDFLEFTDSEEEEVENNENVPISVKSSPVISKASPNNSTPSSSPNQLPLVNEKSQFNFNSQIDEM